MKRQTTLFLLALVCFAMLQTSCEPILTPKAGKKVQFSVSSKTGVKTKTQYSGAVTEDSYERIDWKPGDKIRIVSSDATKVATSSGGDSYDYTVGAVSTRGQYSDASLADAPGTNGLVWGDDDDLTSVSFFGSYPAVQYVFPEGKQAPVFQHMTISAEQTPSWDSNNSNTGSPDMAQAYLLSAPAQYNSTDGKVHMDFYPVFNAFEIDLASKETALTLTQLQLISESSNLAGRFNFYSSNNSGYNFNANGPVPDGIEILSDATKILTVKLSGKTISSAADGHVHFTILALPGDLTDITLAVTFVDPTDSTKEKTRKLKLQQNGRFITFPAFGKARLNGLALENGESWQLEIDGNVLPWTSYDETINQQVSIQGKVAISGTIESTNAWQTDVGGGRDNHYADSDWVIGGTSGYDKNYQIRTLNRDLPEEDRYFTMTFTPTAPTGGYWKLIPTFKEGDNESYKHYRFEVILPGGEPSTQLTGQIINSQVTVKIYPQDWSLSDMNTYDMWFTCYFSPSINFTPSISADSEFQDVHGDGRFSYWVFRLAQYSEHWIDE